MNSREPIAQPRDQAAVELDDARMKIRDVLEVRIAGAEIVDDEVHAAIANLRQDALAEMKVRERDALGDLEIQLFVVLEDRIVRLDEPLLVELGGMDVDEQLVVRNVGDRHLAQHAAELARAVVLDRRREQIERTLKVRRARAGERLVGEDLVGTKVDDRLIDAPDGTGVEHVADRRVCKGRTSRTHVSIRLYALG